MTAGMRPSGRDAANHDSEMISFAERAVARWATFPVRADPRAVVLLHGPVQVEGGFATGNAKIAFTYGAAEADDGVPAYVLRTLSEVAMPTTRLPAAPLRITSAVLSQTVFPTDRGEQRLGAWKLDATDALGAIWVLTEDVLARSWSPPEASDRGLLGPHMLLRATVGPRDRQLIVEFVGGSEQRLRYDAELVESPTALCVVPLGRPTGEQPVGTWVAAEGHIRKVDVTLAEPLGDRVLVNLDGSPVSVTPDPQPRATVL